MAKATLDAPLTLDPQQATTLTIVAATLEFGSKQMQIHYELRAANGGLLEKRTITADGVAVQTYVGNQEAILYTRLLAKLGVSGTVA